MRVIEGSGDHCCEYNELAVLAGVLGPDGHNFGAGMNGGFAFGFWISDNTSSTKPTMSWWSCTESQRVDGSLIASHLTMVLTRVRG